MIPAWSYSCTSWLVIKVVITGIWLLGLHVEKSALINNCPNWRAFDTLCMRRRIELRNCRHRSGVICCVVIDRGRDQGWSVTIVVWWQRPEMVCCRWSYVEMISSNEELHNDREHRSYQDGRVLGAKRAFWSVSRTTEAFEWLNTWHYPVRIIFWSLQMRPALPLVGAYWREAGEWSRWKLLRNLWLNLMLVVRGKSGPLMWIFRIDVVIVLLNDSWCLFGSRCHDDWDREKQQLISCLSGWSKFSGCEPSFQE